MQNCRKGKGGEPCSSSAFRYHVMEWPSNFSEAHFVGEKVDVEHDVQSAMLFAKNSTIGLLRHQPTCLECAEV